MAGTLYVVATPLGNLGDLTPRGAATFDEVDFIAAEDTRVTLRLLNHLGLKKQLISCHEHNEGRRSGEILDRIAAGESCALCSDAGMPAVSDPGEELVTEAHERGIRVVPVPAASAALTALCVSGQSTARFVFEGFLPQQRRARAERLAALQPEQRTLLFYEAPHKLVRTLEDLAGTFGAQRSVTVCRELTKLHEEIWKTTLEAALAHYRETAPRGEFVLVLAGGEPPRPEGLSLRQAAERALELAEREELSLSAAAKMAAGTWGHPRSALYKTMLELKEEV